MENKMKDNFNQEYIVKIYDPKIEMEGIMLKLKNNERAKISKY